MKCYHFSVQMIGPENAFGMTAVRCTSCGWTGRDWEVGNG